MADEPTITEVAEQQPELDTPLVRALHDEIDEQEALRDEARAVVEELRGEIFRLVEETGDEVDALQGVALLVEQRLDAITSKAVRRGYNAALKRAAALGK